MPPKNSLTGYKTVFGFVMPDWVDDRVIRIVTASFLGLIVLLFVMILIVWPAMDNVKTLKTRVSVESEKLEKLKRSKQDMDLVESKLTDYDRSLLFAAMPIEYSPDSTIFMLRGLANENGVSLMSYNLPEGVLLDTSTGVVTDKKPDFVQHKIQIVVSGSIENILRYMTKVDGSLPFGVVSDLNVQEISKLSKLGQSDNVQTTLEIQYYQPFVGKVNLSDLKQFTNDDISLVSSLRNFRTVSGVVVGVQSELTASESATVGVENPNIFGL